MRVIGAAMHKRLTTIILIGLLLTTATLAEELTVRPGDDLRSLAERALGSGELWRLLLTENEELVSQSPTSGDTLTLPGPELGWAELIAGEGHVVVGREHGGFAPLHPDTALAPGDITRTGELSAAHLAVGSAEVILSPQTALHLEGITNRAGATSALLEVLYGRVRSVIERVLGNGEEFSVAGPTAVALVRGTDFEVAVPDPGTTLISVHRGRVEVRPTLLGKPTGEPFFLEAGEGAVVREHDVIRAPLPTAPVAQLPANGEELPFGKDTAQRVAFDWNVPAGATRVFLQIAADPDFTRLLEDTELTASESFSIELAAGEYYWRLAASDDNGLRGAWGEGSSFSVSVDEIPPRLKIGGWSFGAGGRSLTIWGDAADAAYLLVGNSPARFNADGSFRVTLPSEPYDGSVPLIATDGVGNSIEHRLIFHLPLLPVGLTGPTGGSGLTLLRSARPLDSWQLRATVGTRYYQLDSTDAKATEAHLGLALGLGGWGEVSAYLPYDNLIDDDGSSRAEMGNLLFEARLAPPVSGDFAYAAYAEAILPTSGHESAEIGSYQTLSPNSGRHDGVAFNLGLAFQYDFEGLLLLANLGMRPTAVDSFYIGVGAALPVTRWLTPTLELELSSPLSDEAALLTLSPGARFQIGDLQLALSGVIPLTETTDWRADLAVVLFHL